VRQVLSRYYEDEQDSLDPSIDELDFLGYLDKQNKGDPFEPNEADPGHSQDPGQDTDSIYNPYQIDDPSTKPKDLGDSAPFIKEVPTAPQFGSKRVFKDEDSPLHYWQQVRREDETADPQEQLPQMSLDCKYASSTKEVISQFILSSAPLVVEFNDLSDLEECDCGSSKTAATLNQIIDKHRHKTLSIPVLDSNQVTVEWKPFNSSEELKKGFVMFKAKSPDSDESHTVVFQFLKDSEKTDVTDPDKVKTYADMPVAISCSCESFLYYGAQWYALQGQYMYMPALRRSVVAPVPEFRVSRVQRGKGLNFRVCKHILAAYKVVMSWKIKTVFKGLMKYTLLSKIMNPEQWKKLLGIDFSYQTIKDYLRSPSPVPPSIRTFFKYKTDGTPEEKDALNALDEYFVDRWTKKSVAQKVEVLRAYLNHPEEIFYFLMREALDKKGRIDERLIREGVILMSKTIDPQYADEIRKGNLDAIPEPKQTAQKGLEGVPEEEKQVGKGTGLVKPEEVSERIPSDNEEEPEDKLYKTPKSKRFDKKTPETKEVGRFGKPSKTKGVTQGVKSPLKPVK